MPSLILLIVTGTGQKKTVKLVQGQEYVIGRSDAADISLDDVKASRQHARLTFDKGKLSVNDLESTNGIYVNNNRTANFLLEKGSKFRIGTTVFSLQADLPQSFNKNSRLKNIKEGRPIYFFLVWGGLLIFMGCFFGYMILQQSGSKKDEKEAVNNVIVNPPGEIKIYNPGSGLAVLDNPDLIKPLEKKIQPVKEKSISREHYRMGLLFYDSGHLKKAIDEWDLALAYDSSNTLVIKKLARALKELDYEVGQHYRSGKMHMKYLRFLEAEREFMIVVELARNKDDERYHDSLKQIEKIQNK